jgi:hypothetical protein
MVSELQVLVLVEVAHRVDYVFFVDLSEAVLSEVLADFLG